MALGKVEKIKFLILISGAKFGGNKFGAPKLASNAFSKPIECPSLHIFGTLDSLFCFFSKFFFYHENCNVSHIIIIIMNLLIHFAHVM